MKTILRFALIAAAAIGLSACAAFPTQSVLPSILAQFVPAGTTASLDITAVSPYGAVRIQAKNITKTDTEITSADLDVTVGVFVHYVQKGFVPAAGEKPQLVTITLPKA